MVFALLVLTLLAAVMTATAVGPVPVPVDRVLAIVAHRLVGFGEVTWSPLEEDIVWNLRLPRALLGALVGALLATAGVLIQAMVRNPLADPYLLGISQGASVGAVAFLVLGFSAFGGIGVSGMAMLGALGAFALVYTLARTAGTQSPLRVILAGVAVGYGLQAVVHFLLLLADTPGQTTSALFWIFGSLAGARWSVLPFPALAVVVALVIAIGRAGKLNALLLGDETALASGVDVRRFRLLLLAGASGITGAAVAVSGAIGFVGLIVPHGVRLLIGGEHRRLLPAAALGGALFLVLCEIASSLVIEGREVPIGVVTGMVGAPVLAALLIARRRGMS